MWWTVLAVALIGICEPVRLGTAVFLVSGPRPLVNLRAFWLGGITMCVAVAVGVLVLLRGVGLRIVHGVVSLAASSTARHIQIVIGVLALLIAALIVRSSVREPARVPARGDSSAQAPQPGPPPVFSRLSAHAQDSLETGIPWLTFIAGLWLSVPPVEYLVALGAILASAAAGATQVTAVAVFAIVSFAMFEIPLVSYLASPAKTQTVMLQLHNWMRGRRHLVFAVIVAVAGIGLLAMGIGSL